jgi:hypothetical protein
MRSYRMSGLMRITMVAMCVCLYGMGEEGTALAQTAPPIRALRIVVLQGEDAVNILKDNQTSPVIVEVLDSRDLPVSGATVRFTMPAAGAGGTFAGRRWYNTFTNDAGRAQAGALKLRGEGAFRIDVTATYTDQTAGVSLNQTTFATTKGVDIAYSAGRTIVEPEGVGVSNRSSVKSVLKRVLEGAAAVGIVAGTVYLFARPSTPCAPAPSPSNSNWACGVWCDPH